ncbi:MAG: hypothetical protein JKY37_29835 [Nannocystaceae bacterium]|nr:hypothetical protein [Nannocystaceae bacterium]
MAYSAVTRAALGIAFGLSAACLNFDSFACSDDTQCDREVDGVCLGGFCSYVDGACPSGLRYDENAGMDLGGQCVVLGGTEGSSGTEGGDDDGNSDSSSGSSRDSGDEVADTASTDDPPDDTGTETGEPTCGASGEQCCAGDACSAGLTCLGDGCSCVASLTTGNRHTCVIKLDGSVHCWGSNTSGQLGQMVITESLVPVPVTGFGVGMIATELSARDHTCALRDDAIAYSWGSNTFGQVDPASGVIAIPTPTIASWATGATSIAAGAGHTCAARNNGTSSTCWGDNTNGQLTTLAAGPTPVNDVAGVVYSQIATGDDFTCAAQVTGTVSCWGSNAQGQLANDIVAVPSSVVPVAALVPNAASISAGAQHVCAHIGTGVRCWGRGDSGQLGDGLGANSATAVVVDLPLTATTAQVVSGPNHSCVLTATGEVYCWGSNDSGQLMLEPDKLGEDGFTLTPVLLDIGTTAVQIATGATHTCVLASTGEVLCWGTNAEGQLGDGTTMYGFDPTPAQITCP